MNKNLAMSKPQSCETCAIHCATATGFSKVNSSSDFAGLFSSAIFLPRVKATLTPHVTLERSDRIRDGFTPHVTLERSDRIRDGFTSYVTLERSDRIRDGFTSYVILGAKRRGSRGAFILEFN